MTDAENFVENIGNNAVETICNALQSFTEVSYFKRRKYATALRT